MSATLPVIETFVSLQGEGPSSGEPAFFLRLAHCNLSCSWCDTKHSWDWEQFDRSQEVEDVPADILLHRLEAGIPPRVHLLVLTGGEPLLHQRPMAPLLSALRISRPDVRVEVETNGTIPPDPKFAALVHLFVVSPKLANSGMPQKLRLKSRFLSALAALPSVVKFVVEAPIDVAEAVEVARSNGYATSRVWVMPQTTSASEVGPLIATLAPAAIAAGVRLSARLHILAWGDARGT
ncbi:7-carboxy-7-deazaguanine synthase QueE [Microbacterium sp. LMI1-1-1.1]|uniref:7-carboxy-7-deazaguanine synthase QueE n=1 Tax=Microbacterium sp. LMI1-1-1.1 TaxID=3135223 RepID=UPI003467C9E6